MRSQSHLRLLSLVAVLAWALSGASARASSPIVVEVPANSSGPVDTGIALAVFDTAVIRGTPTAFLGVALMTLGFYAKARLEERFLREELGPEAYDAYAKRVPMLVPFLKRAAAALDMANNG